MKELGGDWMEVCNNSIKYACDLIGFDIAPRENVMELHNGEISLAFRDTTWLSHELNISKSKLDTLLHWVIEHNPHVEPFVANDSLAGYVVSSFFLRQLEKKGVRLDQFLKKMVSGKASLR